MSWLKLCLQEVPSPMQNRCLPCNTPFSPWGKGYPANSFLVETTKEELNTRSGLNIWDILHILAAYASSSIKMRPWHIYPVFSPFPSSSESGPTLMWPQYFTVWTNREGNECVRSSTNWHKEKKVKRPKERTANYCWGATKSMVLLQLFFPQIVRLLKY